MKIVNQRVGFATNSSSTHSIILSSHAPHSCSRFYSSKTDKEDFLWLVACYDLEMVLSYEDAVRLIKSYYPKFDNSGYLDKTYYVPKEKTTNRLDLKFWKLFIKAMKNNDISIAEYDDWCLNKESLHPAWTIVDSLLKRSSTITKWYDDKCCLLKSPNQSTTIDFAKRKKLVRPSTPDLVDLKITNMCNSQCSFCYQGSTPDGKHAELFTIINFLSHCGWSEVLEIAIGGGEPTLHPNFAEILVDAHTKGLIVNFATRSLKWIKDSIIRDVVLSTVGKFAFSVGSIEEVREVYKHLIEYPELLSKVAFHYILDLYSLENFIEVYKELEKLFPDTTLTLLGYKELCGRAGKRPYKNVDWLTKLLEIEDRTISLGIDTLIAHQYKKQLKKAQIPQILYQTQEGITSMYYDAVEEVYSKSSFDAKQFEPARHRSNLPIVELTSWFERIWEKK